MKNKPLFYIEFLCMQLSAIFFTQSKARKFRAVFSWGCKKKGVTVGVWPAVKLRRSLHILCPLNSASFSCFTNYSVKIVKYCVDRQRRRVSQGFDIKQYPKNFRSRRRIRLSTRFDRMDVSKFSVTVDMISVKCYSSPLIASSSASFFQYVT